VCTTSAGHGGRHAQPGTGPPVMARRRAGMVTVGQQPLLVAEGRKLAALIAWTCDDAEEWRAALDAAQAEHDAARQDG
jgi:hypothetical protein